MREFLRSRSKCLGEEVLAETAAADPFLIILLIHHRLLPWKFYRAHAALHLYARCYSYVI